MLYCDDLGASAAFTTSVVSPQGLICTRSSVLARVLQKGRTDGTHITSRERVIRGSTIEPWKTLQAEDSVVPMAGLNPCVKPQNCGSWG